MVDREHIIDLLLMSRCSSVLSNSSGKSEGGAQ